MRTLRETLGEYYDIMIDGFQRWDLPYSQQWCKRVEQYHPRWLEEPVRATHEDETLPRLRQVTSIPIATGEGRSTRWDFFHLLQQGAADVLQPEPERLGTSEIMKICALAGVWGLIVSPHHNRINALSHIVASQTTEVCPLVEYRQNNFLNATYFERDPIHHNGKGQVELSDRPGYGLEIDESKVVKRELVWTTAQSA
jgi:L-rhamnonate dehydratase